MENDLTCWLVAQAGSNDEKKWGLKISLDCPFKACGPGVNACVALAGQTLNNTGKV